MYCQRDNDNERERHMKLIPDWSSKNLQCYFCGETRSVKYTMRIKTQPENIKPKEVCVCNRCALVHNDEAIKE